MQARETIEKRTYKVFMSSTYLDNKDRRKRVEDAIQRAGMIHVGMERFTADARPTLETCLEYAREADVLVGIIAWRYGWIPDGRRFSITELEYDAANERLMFVIDPSLPVVPDRDFDPGNDRWEKQGQLQQFKSRISRDQMPAVFDDTGLGVAVYDALLKWKDRKDAEQVCDEPAPAPVPAPTGASAPKLDAEVDAYCKKADTFYANLPVAGFTKQIKVPIDIEEIYIPLRAMIDLSGTTHDEFADAAEAEKCLAGHERQVEIPLPEAFAQSEKLGRRGTVILGDPGSGKTTHLKRLLLWCVRRGADTIGLPAGMTPVFLPLRNLRDLGYGLDAFIQDELANPHLGTAEGFGRHVLERGNLLFLLDGLDEVADPGRRAEVSQWIDEAVRAHGDCRFVVTCRYAGYTEDVSLNEHFIETHIRPLSGEQAETFVRTWYRLVERGLATDSDQARVTANERADDLVESLRAPDFRARRVFELTRNPLLLTNICLVHRHRNKLPRKRARLYKECIDVLLEHWHDAKASGMGMEAEAGRRVLQPVAYWLHGEDGRTRATVEQLTPVMRPALDAIQWKGGLRAFLEKVRNESGLLTGWDHKHYGFMHLGFQEYLAAREIRTRAFLEPELLAELASHFGESWWQEVGLLLLALEDPSLFAPYMREVVKLPQFVEHAGLIAACLDDAAEVSSVPFVELLQQEPGTDRDLWARQATALRIVERIDEAAAETLADHLRNHPSPDIRERYGERRADAGRDIILADRGGYELVRTPGGVFMMGSPETEEGRFADEGPRRRVHVPDFYMGRYAVTNEQYAAFLAGNSGVEEPEYWGDRKRNQPRQPVVGVNWEHARRYADWAGLRLPSEAEWEFACRAGTTTQYYLGDGEDRLKLAGWYRGNASGQTHPVGEKEPNRFGLYDMHGNVWEWVEDDWHGSYEGAPQAAKPWVDDTRAEGRVVRGGGWDYVAQFCRSAVRFDFLPGYRGPDVGFRLSRSIS